MKDPKDGAKMIDVALSRIVIREGSEQQYIFLQEAGGGRGFPIVIGTVEACEIRRVVAGLQTPRPLTHQLAFETIRALESELKHVDIVDLRENTFFAQLVLHKKEGAMTAVVDARPSDAVALALRANCPIRVAQSVLDMVRTDSSGPDVLPDSPPDAGENPGEADPPDEGEGSDEGGSKPGPGA
jgi:bifunctional DNase/RNase